MHAVTSRPRWGPFILSFALFGGVVAGPAGAAGDSAPDGLTDQDRAGIRAAYDAHRHAVHPVEGGHLARNPGQSWLTRFDGCGFSVAHDSGGWTWGLELERYGFAGDQRAPFGPAWVHADGQRITYAWDDSLEEWYVNDQRGLEHGYTVRRRLARGAGRLNIDLAIRGALHPEVVAGGWDVRFVDARGQEALTYSGLTVFDADGRTLPARFELAGESLRISIDERGARYPLTVDPIAQHAYLKAHNTDGGDSFGHALAASGNIVVVGAPYEHSSATGVNGNAADNSAVWAGAAYVFAREGVTWSLQAYLKASNTDVHDRFGWSVAISGNTVVVGAPVEASNAIIVNGNQGDNSAYGAGAAYVFVYDGTSWSQEAYLKASNAQAGDEFGISVAISEGTIVVGARYEDSSAVNTNGNQGDNSAPEAGAAYVFAKNGGAWAQQAYLKASNTGLYDQFGSSVGVSGDHAVVGAWGEDSIATGVNGNGSDDSALDAGAAYTYYRNGTNWFLRDYIKASNTDAGDRFGHSVGLSGDSIVIGAPLEDSNAIGVGGNQSDNSTLSSGAAYVYRWDGLNWSQQAYLKASNSEWDDQFGIAVAISGDRLVVGSWLEDSLATGVNGNQADNGAGNSGAAYVFEYHGTTWIQDAYLKASNTWWHDNFGRAVAISGAAVVCGAPYEDSDATTVNGDQANDNAWESGAAYVFDLEATGLPFCVGDPGVGTQCPCNNDNDGTVPGSGCANGAYSSGAQLAALGTPSVSNDTVVLFCTGLAPSNSGLYFQADNTINAGNGYLFGDGLRCVGGGLIRLQVRPSNADGYSATTISISVKGEVLPGQTKHYQCWYRDTTGSQPCGVGVWDYNLSNGYKIVWLP